MDVAADIMHKRSRDESEDACTRPTAPRDDITIREALLTPVPNAKFKILARAADYYPFNLEDSAVLRCTTCGQV